jgi:hypothetical protein
MEHREQKVKTNNRWADFKERRKVIVNDYLVAKALSVGARRFIIHAGALKVLKFMRQNFRRASARRVLLRQIRRFITNKIKLFRNYSIYTINVSYIRHCTNFHLSMYRDTVLDKSKQIVEDYLSGIN